MSVSKREGIAWSGGALTEDTETLVLTGRTYFVDIRVARATASRDAVLEWAFAGTRSCEDVKAGASLCRWTHLVDSRTSEPAEDQGIVRIDPDNPLKSIETGSMLNPTSGYIEPYEERWVDDDIPRGTLVAFLEKQDGSAFIGIIGKKRQIVGQGFCARVEGERVFFSTGIVEGHDLILGDRHSVGEIIGQWIVREFWKMGDQN